MVVTVAAPVEVTVPADSVVIVVAPLTLTVPPETAADVLCPRLPAVTTALPEIALFRALDTVTLPPEIPPEIVAVFLAVKVPDDMLVTVAAPVEVTVAPARVPSVVVPVTFTVPPVREADVLWKLPVTLAVPSLNAVAPVSVRLPPKELEPVPVKLVAVTA
jgi:hypothetical protein